MQNCMKNCVVSCFSFILLLAFSLPSYAGVTEDFVLGPGDVLEITVWQDETLSRSDIIVRPDGKISFPLVGDTLAQGLTVSELRNNMVKKIEEYVPDSPVTVILQEIGSTRVYVIGKVNNPGMYLMVGKMTVLQVLALAGGMTPYSDNDDILIVRQEKDGTQRYLPFNYSKVLGGDSLEENITLLPNDVVMVP